MVICSVEKRKLIEEVGLHLEGCHKLTPLASRIYALTVLSSNDGYSFEELVELTQASKSSVSTNLTLLVQLDYLEFYTKPGVRKRYFRGTGNFVRSILKEHLQSLEQELKLVEKINLFNQEHNPKKFVQNQSIGNIFHEYLGTQKQNLHHALEKISAFKEETK